MTPALLLAALPLLAACLLQRRRFDLLDLDAKPLSQIQFTAGDAGISPFVAPSYYTTFDMKSLYRPPAGSKVRDEVGDGGRQEAGELATKLGRDFDAELVLGHGLRW